MKPWIVDRMEEGWAVCEKPDGSMTTLALSQLPAGVREGDCLVQKDGEWRIDPEQTKQRRKQIAGRFRALFGASPDARRRN